jgi:nucleoside-diphosphate-sugar epimerase
MASIFLTGASGFVGVRLRHELERRGHRVAVLTRGPGEPTAVRGDLLSPETYEAALTRTDVVVHLAAATGKLPPAEYRRVNVEGTRALLLASQRGGNPRFIFVSTIAVGFPGHARYPYAESKREAEELVARSPLPYAIVRPTMVAGPGSPLFAGLARLAGLPVIPAFAGARAQVQPILVDDLACLMADLVDAGDTTSRTFEFGGPEILSLRDLLARLHRHQRRTSPRFVPIPVSVVIPILAALERVALRAVPVTVGQLATFRFDAIAKPNPLWEARRACLTGIEEMIACSLPA